MTAWSDDWSYAYLRRLMAKIQASYRLTTLEHAPDVLRGDERVAFVRHDVDVSLERARDLALLEKSWGITATYHVMLSCPFYDVTDRSAREALAAIRDAGHEIGLHYHPTHDESASPPHPAAEEIAAACKRLEDTLGDAVRSVSFHLPPPGLIGGPLSVADRVNAYAAPLLEWYLSDSRARWREGEPLKTLDNPRSRCLQVLVHPLWWGEQNETPTERLAVLVKELAADRRASFEEIADLVQKHILVFATVPPPA